MFMKNPVQDSYKDLMHAITGNNPGGAAYEKPKELLHIKLAVDSHNKMIITSLIQIIVSIALLFSSIVLAIATFSK